MKSIVNIFSKFLTMALVLQGLTGSHAQADIVGGDEVQAHDPIEASVIALYQESAQGGALCSATLIAKNIALTAAHCVDHGTQNMAVIFGDKITSKDRTVIRVIKSEVPRGWKEKHLTDRDLGDIAVIQFEGKLPKGYHPAKMAPKKLKLSAGQEVTLAGYGISDAKKHTGAGTLRKTNVAIAQPDFGKTEIVLNQTEGSGACHGDSGGPAFIRDNGKLYLMGVTNRGYPNGAPDDCRHEVVYTKVSAYKKWITETVREMKQSK